MKQCGIWAIIVAYPVSCIPVFGRLKIRVSTRVAQSAARRRPRHIGAAIATTVLFWIVLAWAARWLTCCGSSMAMHACTDWAD